MSIESIARAAGIGGIQELRLDALTGSAQSNVYETLTQSLEQLNTGMVDGQGALRELAQGDMDNLHQLIIGMERTRLGFDLLMSVRNRLLEAYQEIMRMQV